MHVVVVLDYSVFNCDGSMWYTCSVCTQGCDWYVAQAHNTLSGAHEIQWYPLLTCSMYRGTVDRKEFLYSFTFGGLLSSPRLVADVAQVR